MYINVSFADLIVSLQIHLYSDGGIDISADGEHLLCCGRLLRKETAFQPFARHSLSHSAPSLTQDTTQRDVLPSEHSNLLLSQNASLPARTPTIQRTRALPTHHTRRPETHTMDRGLYDFLGLSSSASRAPLSLPRLPSETMEFMQMDESTMDFSASEAAPVALLSPPFARVDASHNVFSQDNVLARHEEVEVEGEGNVLMCEESDTRQWRTRGTAFVSTAGLASHAPQYSVVSQSPAVCVNREELTMFPHGTSPVDLRLGELYNLYVSEFVNMCVSLSVSVYVSVYFLCVFGSCLFVIVQIRSFLLVCFIFLIFIF